MTDPYMAKYPFFEAAREAVGEYDLAETLQNDAVLDRAAERITHGVNGGTIGTPANDDEIELRSYPAARILVSLIDDYRIINRYARAEARTTIERFKDDFNTVEDADDSPFRAKDGVALDEALDEFDINATETSPSEQFEHTAIGHHLADASPREIRGFAADVFHVNADDSRLADDHLTGLNSSDLYNYLHSMADGRAEATWYEMPFSDYVTVAVGMSDVEWRLVNRGIAGGNVFVSLRDLYEMLEEAAFQRVSDRLPHDVPDDLRELLGDRAEAVRDDIDDDHFSYEIDRVEPGLFPPVIENMMEDFPHNLKHEEKMTLAAFFLHIGMTTEEVLETLGVINTPGEDPTRYQVNHIKKGGGDGEPYTPANYATIESWGYEWEKDALEQEVTNPLTYYKIKLRDEDEQQEADDDAGDQAADDVGGVEEPVEPEDETSLADDDAGPDASDVMADFADAVDDEE